MCSISISHDSQYIVFSYIIAHQQAIYIANSNGSGVKQVTFPIDDYHVSPEFSFDGEQILYISYQKKSEKPESRIFIMNRDGSNVKQVTSNRYENIIEAVFSADGNQIFFLSSSYYGKYSPVYRAGAHDVDIFSIRTDGTDLKQLTHLKAYRLSDLAVSADEKELHFYYEGTPNRFCSLKLDGTEEMKSIAQPYSDNGPSFEYRLSPDRRYLAFVQPASGKGTFKYELFCLDIKTQEVKQLTYLGKRVTAPRFFHQDSTILFIHDLGWPSRNSKYELMQINLDGSELKKIDLAISH